MSLQYPFKGVVHSVKSAPCHHAWSVLSIPFTRSINAPLSPQELNLEQSLSLLKQGDPFDWCCCCKPSKVLFAMALQTSAQFHAFRGRNPGGFFSRTNWLRGLSVKSERQLLQHTVMSKWITACGHRLLFPQEHVQAHPNLRALLSLISSFDDRKQPYLLRRPEH